MSKIPYYKVSTSPKKLKKTSLENVAVDNPKRKLLIASVVVVYLIASTLLGFFIFNQNNLETAQASNGANITTSLRFVSEKQFKVGDNVEVIVTLQNTSVTENIENIALDLLSSQESVKWSKASNKNTQEDINPIQNNKFNFPNLTFGERSEYVISGIYQNSELDFLTILGKIKYSNSKGDLEVDTNRIYTNLNPGIDSSKQLLSLSSNKEIFNQSESIVLTLAGATAETPLTLETKGKVYINKRNTSEVVATFDCLPEDSGQCQFTTTNLAVGQYSSLYISETGDVKSNILWFDVKGAANNSSLIPLEQASLKLPFESASVNGLVPVIAERVISQNQSPDNSPACVFEVYAANKLVLSLPANIEDTRTCRTEISTDQLGSAGLYKIKLANSALEKDIAFGIKPLSLMAIQNLTPNSLKDQDISIKISDVKDDANLPVTLDNLKLKIYHKQSGIVQELTNRNGERLKIVNGEFETVIPGSYFGNYGSYLIWVETEAGRISDFNNISFSNNQLAFSNSGVIIEDNSKLRVGENINLKLNGIQDRQGQIVSQGNCVANFYSAGNAVSSSTVEGVIKNGTCNVTLTQGKITKSGPLLISFDNVASGNSLGQSKQVQLAPGVATDFGEINLEQEPAVLNFANNAIIGPVVDQYGNSTNSFNNQIVVATPAGDIIKEIDNVSIIDGFAKVLIPSSLVQEQFVLILKDSFTKELLSKEFATVNSPESLTTPNIPGEAKNDSAISISTKYLGESEIENCTFRFIKNTKEILEQQVSYDKDKEICQLDWNLNQYRNTEQVLIQILAGDKKYNKIIKLNSSEAANVFSVHPEIRFNKQKEMQISLLTSPIVDSKGLPVTSGEIKWQFNGKIEKTNIQNGFARLPILASKLESRDIRVEGQNRFLDLDLNISASISSVSQTNNISLYLGNYDISTTSDDFKIHLGSNYVSKAYNKILAFESQSCEAFILSNNFTSTTAKTHLQGNLCYVETTGNQGENNLVFENNGFEVGNFDYKVGQSIQELDWCLDSDTKCHSIQVKTPITSNIEAIIYDDQNQYKFSSPELDNLIKIEQNGLNPLKEYLVEIRYFDIDGNQISHYKTLLGEQLSK